MGSASCDVPRARRYRVFLDVKLFGELGVGGIMPEGQRRPTADLHELRTWVSRYDALDLSGSESFEPLGIFSQNIYSGTR